jgi:hypothetical protein
MDDLPTGYTSRRLQWRRNERLSHVTFKAAISAILSKKLRPGEMPAESRLISSWSAAARSVRPLPSISGFASDKQAADCARLSWMPVCSPFRSTSRIPAFLVSPIRRSPSSWTKHRHNRNRFATKCGAFPGNHRYRSRGWPIRWAAVLSTGADGRPACWMRRRQPGPQPR